MNTVKRKERAESSTEGQNPITYKRTQPHVGSSSTAVQPPLSGIAGSSMPQQPYPNLYNPQNKIVQSQPQQQLISPTMPGNATQLHQKDMDKNKRKIKRKPPRRLEVEVPIESTWDKLSKTHITIPIAQYFAENKKVAQDVKLGLTHLHRRRPRRKITATTNQKSSEPMIINTLRTNGLLDEEQYKRNQVNHVEASRNQLDTESDYDSSYDDSDHDMTSTEADTYETDDETDSQIDYPFKAEDMRLAQPCRVLIVINNQPVEAVLDTGAAVSSTLR